MSPGEQLMARLGLDTSGFKAGLKEAHGVFKTFSGGLAGLLSVSGFAAYSKEVTEYGARVSDLGKRYGVSTDAIQKFGNAAEQNGSSLEGVAKGFGKLDLAISKALGGNETILKSFSALGITIDDLRKLSPEEIMKKLGSSSLNAADMVKVLGKSALELRPLLKGIADGSIEIGDAIERGQIEKLKEADKLWKKIGENIRLYSAAAITAPPIAQHKNQGGDIVLYFKSVRKEVEAEFNMLKAVAHGDFDEMKRQGAIAAQAIKESFHGLPKPSAAGVDAGVKMDSAMPKSKAALDAEKKDRERGQLSLKELQTEGPSADVNIGGGRYLSRPGTAQMMYAAQQARLVDELEQRAKHVRLTGMSATGESSADLLSRADAIRQTLPIKESEKEVGIYRQAFKDALADTNAKLDNIEAQLE